MITPPFPMVKIFYPMDFNRIYPLMNFHCKHPLEKARTQEPN